MLRNEVKFGEVANVFINSPILSRFFPQLQPFEASSLQLPPGVQISKIVAGLGNIILLDYQGALWVMGDNKRGQLGLPMSNSEVKDFTQIELSDPVQDVKTGLNFTLALTSKLIRKR